MQCELSKLQINIVKSFHFSVKNSKNRFISRLTDGFERFFTGKPVRIQINLNWSNRSVFTGFYRFTVGKPLPVGSGFSIQNSFVNRGHHPSAGMPRFFNFKGTAMETLGTRGQQRPSNNRGHRA
jgi:hypothetical protein